MSTPSTPTTTGPTSTSTHTSARGTLGPAVRLGEGADPLGEPRHLALGLRVNLLSLCHGQDATDG